MFLQSPLPQAINNDGKYINNKEDSCKQYDKRNFRRKLEETESCWIPLTKNKNKQHNSCCTAEA